MINATAYKDQTFSGGTALFASTRKQH